MWLIVVYPAHLFPSYWFSEQVNNWNAQTSAARTLSQSSGGDNGSDSGGWSAPVSTSANRTSPLSAVTNPVTSADPSSWVVNNNGPDMRRIAPATGGTRWESNPGPPMRANSVSTDVGKYGSRSSIYHRESEMEVFVGNILSSPCFLFHLIISAAPAFRDNI